MGLKYYLSNPKLKTKCSECGAESTVDEMLIMIVSGPEVSPPESNVKVCSPANIGLRGSRGLPGNLLEWVSFVADKNAVISDENGVVADYNKVLELISLAVGDKSVVTPF